MLEPSMILVAMLDPSMTVRPVKLSVSFTGLTVMLGSIVLSVN